MCRLDFYSLSPSTFYYKHRGQVQEVLEDCTRVVVGQIQTFKKGVQSGTW